jgi:hypothetical protein
LVCSSSWKRRSHCNMRRARGRRARVN